MPWRVLGGLSDAEVEDVLDYGRPRRFSRREVVWHEGDRADPIHFIKSGRVAVQVMTSLGEAATVAVMGPGDVAGLVDSHCSDVFHATSAVALQDTQTVAIRDSDFADIRRRFPSVNDAVLAFFADKVIDLTKQVVDAHYVPAETRVLRRLVGLADLYDQGDAVIEIPLTQEDLAEIAGVTRPTANRVLKKEQERGSIKLGRGVITVVAKERLKGRAR